MTNSGFALRNHPQLLTDDNLAAIVYHKKKGFKYYEITKGGFQEAELPGSLKSPLGSLWKLFSYIYIIEKGLNPPPYFCSGQKEAEKFCCAKGESIDLDLALIKSCGLYFNFDRLKISQTEWRDFWENKIGVSYKWLIDKNNLIPETEVDVEELLLALSQIEKILQLLKKVKTELTRVLIKGTAKGALQRIGAALKVKTFTWDDPAVPQKYIGGFAGWLYNNDIIWLVGKGTSKKIFTKWVEEIALLSQNGIKQNAGECVKVHFFDRYPIQTIKNLESGNSALPGTLTGKNRITFTNGVQLDFLATSELTLQQKGRQKTISGVFDINNYIARVIEREIKNEPEEAAKAFAIAIRTFLFQNSKFDGSCYQIVDSTSRQRVSIQPPTIASKRISLWTDRLIIKGEKPVHYHSTKSAPGIMSWTFAKQMAENGFFFDEILRIAYRQHKIDAMDHHRNYVCTQLSKAEGWLKTQAHKWDRYLQTFNGYQKPNAIKICNLDFGKSFANLNNNNIFVTAMAFEENRISIAHEYLHIAFKHHPLTMNEEFIEETARKLVLNFRETYGNF